MLPQAPQPLTPPAFPPLLAVRPPRAEDEDERKLGWLRIFGAAAQRSGYTEASQSLSSRGMTAARRIPVAVLGATGSVGQRFVELLADHPWFELAALCASPESVGKRYADAVRWVQARPLPERARDAVVGECTPDVDCPLVFSALDAALAGPLETACRDAGRLVVTNASSHRLDPDVPLLVPEVNADSLDALVGLADGGAIVANPNCTTAALALALAPLHRRFGAARAHVVTMQAVSGAGLAGPTAYETVDNLIPYIAGEEEKIAAETRKIVGDVLVSATCTRVGVVDGHTLCVSVELSGAPSAEDLVEAWRAFRGAPQELGLPSAPAHPAVYLERRDAPQPRLHRELEGGMATVIGRLRPCPLLGWKFVALGHNTLRGAAGGAVLAAELAVARGLLG